METQGGGEKNTSKHQIKKKKEKKRSENTRMNLTADRSTLPSWVMAGQKEEIQKKKWKGEKGGGEVLIKVPGRGPEPSFLWKAEGTRTLL